MSIYLKRLPSIKSFQCFIAVAHELNFRRAAESLNMSQPPLSRAIKDLEEQLNVKLIERSTHHVRLTVAGEQLKREICPILLALHGVVDQLQPYLEKVPQNHIRIGLTSVIDFSLISKVHNVLKNLEFTEHVLHPERSYSKNLVEQVRRKEIDLAIVGDIQHQSGDLAIYEIAMEPLMIALPATHPSAHKQQLTFNDLGMTPLFWFSRADNPTFYDKCEYVFEKFGYHPPRQLEPKNYVEMLALISAGKGISFPPSSMEAASRVGVVYRQFVPEIERFLSINIQLVMDVNEARPNILDLMQHLIK